VSGALLKVEGLAWWMLPVRYLFPLENAAVKTKSLAAERLRGSVRMPDGCPARLS